MAAALGVEPSPPASKAELLTGGAASNWYSVTVSIRRLRFEGPRCWPLHQWSMKLVRTPGAAPGTSGWKPDTLLLRHVRAEGRRHDHHTVAGATSVAGSAGTSPVDLPKFRLRHELVSTGRLEGPHGRRRLCQVEHHRNGASAMARTSIARLEDGSLSCWQTEAWTRRRESNSLVGFCRPYPGRLGPSCWQHHPVLIRGLAVQSRALYRMAIKQETVNGDRCGERSRLTSWTVTLPHLMHKRPLVRLGDLNTH